jgi:acyl-CoA synthetase (AMP-forming)/AMP-acid ligase II
MNDGALFVAGRVKDLIIIDGRNHYPQDIEQTVEESHVALESAGSAAFSVDVHGQERLVVVAEVSRAGRALLNRKEVDPDDIIKAVRRAVASRHDIDTYDVTLLRVGGILKTSSGKVRRHACRAGFLSRSLATLDLPVAAG